MKNILWIVIALFSTGVVADDMQGSLNKLCKTIQHCAMEQAGSNANKEMQALLQPMLDAMCQQMEQGYTEALTEQPQLESKALACVQSLAALSCDELLSRQDEESVTKACETYKQEAQAAQ